MSNQSSPSAENGPVVLCILDGWGERSERENNAIALAETPNWDRLVGSVPKTTLDASAEEVGLPSGQMGNSEVGHMNLGAGRVVMQDLPRIDAALAGGEISAIPAFGAFVRKMKASGGVCHLIGLMSPGGVHSHQDHMAALVRLLAAEGIRVAVHAFMDGRDTPPKSGRDCLEKFTNDIAAEPDCRIATVIGRYYAMDRDNRWDRVARGYNAMVSGEGIAADSAEAAITAAYAEEQTDEFVSPRIVGGYAGMADGDGVLMANFRADRAREILAALFDPGFDGFERARVVELPARLGMVEYSTELSKLMDCLFAPTELSGILGEVVSRAGLAQLRIAETEKYAHVTFFLNGGREEEFEGEERILVPSPDVATYDLQPEMSAPELTDRLVEAIKSKRFSLIVVNYANGDMVGHTGILAAAIKAAGAVDVALGRLEAAVKEVGGALLVTADHGNCERMYDDEASEPHTQHTLNAVPALLINGPAWVKDINSGRLSDVAPTVLELMGLEKPSEMTGRSLLEAGSARTEAAQ